MSAVARVMVVEDEPNIAAIIAFKLGREGHDLTMLECARALTEALRGSKPELVVLDSSLPDADALTLVPLSMYFKDGRAKLDLALAKGRRSYDKRHAIAARDADMEAKRAGAARRRSLDA